ncbi:twin-arginine translocase subunit TatC [Aquibacillus sp. 3ASR75-11]|uniref:Sec-independent protein translocase protein TatC n=1 Tax=Terrihalobacillus insolitus TaxID=2950438 RepID=A0A9X4ANP0_9BACI|nr:twin-arginine translocase subunit TatC [Terrihalobacillus insolitus]MDC3412980.1 twin-arginine translocase subunit TatC [Terrihalobacillus insolitus]MDC3424733.1 twin-arginine translocase subunit TatC [Terrihalobacillus insolitus]
MNVTEHLSELRWRIIWSLIVFVVFFIFGFVYSRDIYSFLEKDIPFKLSAISPVEIIWILFTMASIVGLIGTIPFLCIQIWLFIKPGLTAKEKKVSLAYIPAVFILFLGGLTFGYYVFVNMIIPFLVSLNDGMVNMIFTADKYFRFLFRVIIPVAVMFEIPVITMFLTSLGVVTPAFLRKTRKYAYFILVIIGTMISPPDFILQLVVAVPFILLYEISVVLSAMVYRKKRHKNDEIEKTNEV